MVAAPTAAATPTRTSTTQADNGMTATSSLHARTLALQQLKNTNGKHTASLVEKLNATRSFYTDANRTTAPPFDIDRKIAAKSKNNDVTERLLESDSQLAHTAVDDATRVYNTNRNTTTFDTQAVEKHLKKAQNALETGDKLRDKGSKGAFAQYERAWYHAQQALDVMDTAITPTITITTRNDPVHTDTITYQVAGTVTDARTHDLSNVTLSLNGNETTVPLQRATTPNGTSYFATTVTLDQRINNITVTVTDPGTTYATRHSPTVGDDTTGNSDKKGGGNDKKGGGNGNQKNANDEGTDSISPATGADTLLLDGDRLPDTYELTTTKTDPLNPNSDSSRTAADESTNAIIDGHEDFDNDDVKTAIEYQNNLDPFGVDTDDDGLTDRFELDYDQLNGTMADTDGDGTPDAAEDFEPDGLTNEREQEYGTDPHDADTDGDQLRDRYEVDTTLTSPTDADSNSTRTPSNESNNGINDSQEDFDGDGLATGIEQEIETNPFVVDTDNDTLTDAFEYAYEPLDPLAADSNDDDTPDGQWDIDDDTLVNVREQALGTSPVDADTDADGLRDDYEVETTLTDPTVADSNSSRTPINESGDGVIDGREDFDQDSLPTELEANLSTNPFDSDTDGDRLTDAFEYEWQNLSPLDADSDNDNTSDDLEDPDADGLNNYLEQEYGTHPFVNDTDGDGIQDGDETNTTKTDPVDPDSDSARTPADEGNNSILDGDEDFDQDSLRTTEELQLNTSPFNPDTDGDRLLDGFEAKTANLSPTQTDTDNDGTPDGAEDFDNDGLTNREEQLAGTNPHKADTDGDGLNDSFELRVTKTSPTDQNSNSSLTDTNESANDVLDGAEDFDGDGLNATQEQRLGTSPKRADTDNDYLPDGYEVRVTKTDPLDSNSTSTRTSVNEAANNRPDGFEDFDDDGVPNFIEYRAGTSPFNEDTDNDSLSDYAEVGTPVLNATNPDTNGDGVLDPNTDFDGDGLNASTEIAFNTSLSATDTDFDGLSDAREVQSLGTDPTSPDTDGDGITDAEELELGTNPLQADSDTDGVQDSNESYTRQVSVNNSNASIRVNGVGNTTLDVTAENVSSENQNLSSNRGPVVEVINNDDAASTQVSVPIETTTQQETTLSIQSTKTATSSSRLQLYHYDPETRALWEPVPTTIENGQATGSIETSGLVTVMDTAEYNAKTTVRYKEPDLSRGSVTCSGPCEVSRDAIVVGDDADTDTVSISGISDDDGNDDSDGDGILNNEDDCPSQPGPKSNDGCPVTETTTQTTDQPTTTTTTTRAQTTSTTGGGDGGGGDDGKAAAGIRKSVPADEATVQLRVSYVTSDVDRRAPPYLEVVGVDSGVTKRYELSVGRGEVQRNIGDEFAGEDVIIRAVAPLDSTVRFTPVLFHDTDGDTIWDFVEERSSIYIPREDQYVSLNPESADTDADGLSDAQEVQYTETSRGYRLTGVYADPTDVNSDDWGLTDYEEYQKGSNPWVQENLTVEIQMPVIAESASGGDEVKVATKGNSNAALLSFTEAAFDDNADKPWTEGYDLDDCFPASAGCKYIHSRVRVTVATTGDDYEVPGDIELKFTDQDGDIYVVNKDGERGKAVETLSEGGNVVNLVVRASRGVNNYNLGKLQAELYIDDSSPFTRATDREQGAGKDIVVRSDREFGLQDLPDKAAKAFTQKAVKKYKTATLAASTIYAPSFAGARVKVGVTTPAAEGVYALSVKGLETAGIKPTLGSVDVQGYTPDVVIAAESVSTSDRDRTVVVIIVQRRN